MKIFKQYLDSLYPSMLYAVMRDLNEGTVNSEDLLQKYLDKYSDEETDKTEQQFIFDIESSLDDTLLE